jgi:long-subunit fatty acid transport protein
VREYTFTGLTVPVIFRPARSYAVGGIATSRNTRIAGEVVRLLYSDAFSPSWEIPGHNTRDTTALRAGIEQSVHSGAYRFTFRGGVAWEPGYTLGGEDFTIVDPPRENLMWLSGGLAFATRTMEFGVGIGAAGSQMRILADVRFGRR